MNKHNIAITDNAFAKALELSASEKGMLLRIAVNGGGCSGFEYDYSTTTSINIDDVLFERLGAKIVIDEMSLDLMENSVIDFVKELGSSKFVINNPKAISKCGCGNSFSIEL